MRTIAIFAGYFLPHLGGIERYVDNLSKQLLKKGYRVIIISSNFDNLEPLTVNKNLINIRIPIYNMFKKRYPIPKKNKEYKRLMSLLDGYNIDRIIVNTRFHLTSHIGAKYGKKHNIPVYLIEHGSQYITVDNKFIDFFANRYEDFLTWKIKNKITKFYGVSQIASDWLVNFKINGSGAWYNSIDTEQKLPKKQNSSKVNFLYAGRLIKQKGVENILNAFVELSKKYKNIFLYIAGDGPEYNKYIQNYKNKNIFFLGKLNYQELLNYYAITDVFLYPPLWPEGLPTSILEAGLMKCTVIGTNQGGISEVLNKENGLLISGDVESLKTAMENTITSKEYRTKLATKLNKDVINKFSWKVTADKIISDMEFDK